MAILTATVVTRAGHDVVGAAAAAGGDEWANSGNEFVQVLNGSGAPITVTLDIIKTVDGAAAVDPTVAIAAGVTKIIGPFPPGIYNNATTGRTKITYSLETSVTVKVLTCPAA